MCYIIMNFNVDNVDVDFYFVKKFFNLLNLFFDVMYEFFFFYFDNGELICWCFYLYKRKKVVWVLDNWNVGICEDYLIYLENFVCFFLEYLKFYCIYIGW